MAKKGVWYRQCKYQRVNENSTCWDVAWLPEANAKVGKRFYLKSDPDEKVYTVVSVGTNRHTHAEAHKKQQTQRNYFKTTDI